MRRNVKDKQRILNTLSDAVGRFLYYDRKEDEELSSDDLRDAVATGVVTKDELVEAFRSELEGWMCG